MSNPSFARVARTIAGEPASDGAGVRLTRVIGGGALPDLDPFLLLDEFGTDKAEDYLAGFPSHPHRGDRRHPSARRCRGSGCPPTCPSSHKA